MATDDNMTPEEWFAKLKREKTFLETSSSASNSHAAVLPSPKQMFLMDSAGIEPTVYGNGFPSYSVINNFIDIHKPPKDKFRETHGTDPIHGFLKHFYKLFEIEIPDSIIFYPVAVSHFEAVTDKSFFDIRALYFGYNIPFEEWKDMNRRTISAFLNDLKKRFPVRGGPVTVESMARIIQKEKEAQLRVTSAESHALSKTETSTTTTPSTIGIAESKEPRTPKKRTHQDAFVYTK